MEKNKKKNFVPRITQLDANEFDKEVQDVLSAELLKIFKYLKPGVLNNVKPEINLFLKLLIFHYSVSRKNATFGQDLLNIKYENPFTKKQLATFTFLNYIVPYLKAKYDDNSSIIENQSIRNIIEKIEIIIKSLSIINLLYFLREGKYPTLVDRLLKLKYIPVTKLNRKVGYNYMTRELLWHGFIELLMYTLPLINYKALKRKLRLAFVTNSSQSKIQKSVVYNPDTKCVICEDFPNLPCRISLFCPHVGCYYCIKSNVLADEKFMCPLCAETNTVGESLQPLQG